MKLIFNNNKYHYIPFALKYEKSFPLRIKKTQFK